MKMFALVTMTLLHIEGHFHFLKFLRRHRRFCELVQHKKQKFWNMTCYIDAAKSTCFWLEETGNNGAYHMREQASDIDDGPGNEGD